MLKCHIRDAYPPAAGEFTSTTVDGLIYALTGALTT
jgi:hypothetical protein